jgi:hypothetical protein
MRLALVAAVFVWALGAADLRAQLVPISQCNAAIPCNIPTAFVPAGVAGLTPSGRAAGGNTLVGAQFNPAEGFKPEVVTREIAEDPTDRAARIFFKHNPSFAMPRTEKSPTDLPAAAAPPAQPAPRTQPGPTPPTKK